MKGQLITARQAATHIDYIALAEGIEGYDRTILPRAEGCYVIGRSRDPITADELWSLSVKLTGIDAGLGLTWEYMRPGHRHNA